MPENTTAVQKMDPKELNPSKPIETQKSLAGMLELYKHRFAEMLPNHLTAERMIKVALTAAMRTPKLLQCSQGSIMESLMRAAELGLDVSGTLGYAYLVPYKNRRANNGRGRMDAQLLIGYRGLAMLAYQSGEVTRVEAEVVHENDFFEYEKGTDFKLRFKPDFKGDRGAPVLVYSLAELRGGSIVATVMTIDEVNAIRKASQNANSSTWVNHWSEMAKKTAFRRLAKWLPLSSDRLNTAIAMHDAEFDYGPSEKQGRIQAQQSRLDELNAELLPNMIGQNGGSDDVEPDYADYQEYQAGGDTEPDEPTVEQYAKDKEEGESPSAEGEGTQAPPPQEQEAAKNEDYREPAIFATWLGQYWDSFEACLEIASFILKAKVVSFENKDCRVANRKRVYNVVRRVAERLKNSDDPFYEVARFFGWAMNAKQAVSTTGDVGAAIKLYREALANWEKQQEQPESQEHTEPKRERVPYDNQF
jgi:recombination protein RecT